MSTSHLAAATTTTNLELQAATTEMIAVRPHAAGSGTKASTGLPNAVAAAKGEPPRQ